MKIKDVLFAVIIYIIFPFSSIFMKYASQTDDMLMKLFLFACSIGVLGIFSILWQMLLKKIDLTKAYIFKSTTIIWNIVYGIILFNEKVSPMMIIGMTITTLGIIIITIGEKKGER